MEDERIWVLLSRKLSKEAIDAELAELNALLEQHPDWKHSIEQLTEVWEQPVVVDPEFMQATYLIHLERMKQKELANSIADKKEPVEPIEKKQPGKMKQIIIYAAAACVIGLLFFSFYYTTNFASVNRSFAAMANSNPDRKEIITENGMRTKTQLPDGSVVWLNAGSKITYDGNLSGALREVYLVGEAYFDVAKQPNRPFIVHTADINIQALGTAFNVRAYPSDKIVEATLLRGLIKITAKNDSKMEPVLLHPDQKFILDKTTSTASTSNINGGKPSFDGTYTILKVDVPDDKELPETAWIYDRLVFRGDDFETLAQKMERWYNVKIVFEDDAVKKLHFNGSLEEETVGQAFEALQMADSFTYKINNREIYVSSITN